MPDTPAPPAVAPAGPPLLLRAGAVLTQNARRDTAEAVLLEAGRVLAVGSWRALRGQAPAGTREIDLQGATLAPGLIDSHPHFLHFAGIDAVCVPLYDAVDHADIVERIAARARITPPGEWILTTPVGEPHYFIRRSWRDLREGRLPDRRVLDAAAPHHPVLLQAFAPRIPNVCAMNSMALQRLGLADKLPERVSDVWIEREADGSPSGVFRGNVTNYYNGDSFWLTHVASQLPRPGDEVWQQGAAAGQLVAARRGVTACYEGHVMDAVHIDAYRRLRREGRLALRVLASLEAAPYAFDHGLELTAQAVRENFRRALAMRSNDDPLLRVDGLTLGRGGPCWPGFLRIDAAYRDAYGRPTRGHTFVPQSLEREAVAFCLAHGLRLSMVQGGHQDHREFLESLQAEGGDAPAAARGWVMQHNILIDAPTARRYAQLGFHLATSMSFSWGKGELYRERIGQPALRDLVPLKRLFDTGANVALGSDWGPGSPWEHMALAESHELAGSGRHNRQPDQPVTRQQAFDGWTRNGAALLQWDGLGAIEPGAAADFCILDRDPLACDAGDLPGTQVLRTVLGGRDVFDAGVLPRLDDAALPAERRGPPGLAEAWRRRGGHRCDAACAAGHAAAPATAVDSQEQP